MEGPQEGVLRTWLFSRRLLGPIQPPLPETLDVPHRLHNDHGVPQTLPIEISYFFAYIVRAEEAKLNKVAAT